MRTCSSSREHRAYAPGMQKKWFQRRKHDVEEPLGRHHVASHALLRLCSHSKVRLGRLLEELQNRVKNVGMEASTYQKIVEMQQNVTTWRSTNVGLIQRSDRDSPLPSLRQRAITSRQSGVLRAICVACAEFPGLGVARKFLGRLEQDLVQILKKVRTVSVPDKDFPAS